MDIKFDQMTVDTSLAQEYLKLHPDVYRYYNEHENLMRDNIFDDKLLVQNPDEIFSTTQSITNPSENLIQKTWNKLRKLASFLRNSNKLIAQLEYHFRAKPIDDTSAQLNLITKYLMCNTPLEFRGDRSDHRILDDDALLKLGAIQLHNPNVICTSKNTFIVCHLFVELCHRAGLNSIYLTGERNFLPQSLKEKNGLNSGTVAVVSEDADIDSAVDIFLTSSNEVPWRLRKILVQENVYQQFKDALSWKCHLNPQKENVFGTTVLCSEHHVYKDRIFLIDPVNLPQIPVNELQTAIIIEAYRTRKEMISLLLKENSHYLSLWSNGIAEINEVTHSTKSPVVWVNNLADFRGPSQIAQAVYSNICKKEINIKKNTDFAKLCHLSQSWLKLDIESRRDILYNALNEYDISSRKGTNINQALYDCTMKSMVDVGKDYVCLVMSEPVGIIGASVEESFFTVETVEAILNGNAVAVYKGKNDSTLNLDVNIFEKLEQAGVPFKIVEEAPPETTDTYTLQNGLNNSCQIRAIWTNSGTIFAN